MRLTSIIQVSILIILFSCESNPVQNCPLEDTQYLKILFIGNSYTEMGDARLPAAFAGLVKADGKQVLVGKAVVGGTDLYYHSESELTEEKINMYYWDYVILQGSSMTIMFPDSFNIIFPTSDKPLIKEILQKIKNKIKSHRACTKIIFVIPWAYEDGLSWLEGRTEDYFAMQSRIIENGIKIGKSLDLITSPVGKAYETVMKEDNDPHYLYLIDSSHPSVKGSYLTACVLYSTVYRDSVMGNNYIDGVTEEEAAHFQEIATQIVLENKDLWNLD